MLIAFSGCAGGGKTALAKEICRQAGYSLRPEGSEETFGKYGIRPPETMNEISKEILRKVKSSQEDFLARFVEQDRNFNKLNINTVCDRGAVDAMAYYLYWCNNIIPEKDYKIFEKTAREHSMIYKAHFVFPPLDVVPEEGVRSSNIIYQETIFSLVVGILSKWGLCYKIIESRDMRERFKEVGEFIGKFEDPKRT